jgi:hypothetical protein
MKARRFLRYFGLMPRGAQNGVDVAPSAYQHVEDEDYELPAVSPRGGGPEAQDHGDSPDYVPPEPAPDEPVHTQGIGRGLAVVFSAVSAVIIWDSGVGEIFVRASVWGQISLIVAGIVFAVAIERFVKLAELQVESWVRLRQIDRLLRRIEKKS